MLKKIKDRINRIRINYLSALRKQKLSRTIDKTLYAFLQKTVRTKHLWYGSSYGGFYVMPDLIKNNSVVYSFGIGKDISFDTKLIQKHGCTVYGFDPTPNSINWIQQQKHSSLFKFFPFGISTSSGTTTFYLPANPKYVSGSLTADNTTPDHVAVEVEMKTWSDICQMLGHKHIDLLKMDIEGAEYQVLENIMMLPITIDQICVEFHDRNAASAVPKSKATVELLRTNGYEIVATSISLEEVTFVHQRKLR